MDPGYTREKNLFLPAKNMFLQFIEFLPPELHSRLRNDGFNLLCPRTDLCYLFSSLPDMWELSGSSEPGASSQRGCSATSYRRVNHRPQQSLLKAEPPKKVSNPKDSFLPPNHSSAKHQHTWEGEVLPYLDLQSPHLFSDMRTVTLMALKSPIRAFLHTNHLPIRHGEETCVDPRVWKCRLTSPPNLALELGYTTATAPVPHRKGGSRTHTYKGTHLLLPPDVSPSMCTGKCIFVQLKQNFCFNLRTFRIRIPCPTICSAAFSEQDSLHRGKSAAQRVPVVSPPSC